MYAASIELKMVTKKFSRDVSGTEEWNTISRNRPEV
jgi:hypothetical protein